MPGTNQFAKYNRNLLLLSSVVAGVVVVRLLIAGQETGNMHGAIVSIAHTLLVAIVSNLALRRSEGDAAPVQK